MNKNNKDEHNNSANESEIESKVVTVGSNQGHRALMVIILALLAGGVYYFYFRPSNKDGSEIIKKEEIKQNVQELKEKLEQVPDNIIVPERIITNPLPPLPPLQTPQLIPKVAKKRRSSSKKGRRETNRNSSIKYTSFAYAAEERSFL